MREYINRLARGKFIYECPKITQPLESVNLDVIKGNINELSFHIHATDVIKGVVYASDSRIVIKDNGFMGADYDIRFSVDARELGVKEQMEGTFCIISSGGEKEIPYVFTVVPESVETSVGKAYNLFHFTNLVQTSREEARSIYASQDFKRIFLNNDNSLVNLYDALYDETHIYESMEEFLIAIKKKSSVTFKLRDSMRVYDETGSSEKDSVVIEKNGWGYVSLNVSDDTDFIEISKTVITSDEFTGDIYELEYIIDAKKLHAGKNFGRIAVSSYNHTEYLDIVVDNVLSDGTTEEDIRIGREVKNAVVSLTKEYLDFRMKKTKKETWLSHSDQILKRVRGIEGAGSTFFDLAHAQINFISGRDEDGQWILDNIKGNIMENIEKNVELYCFYLYVNTLAQKNEQYTEEVIKIVTKYFENGYDTWRILWILFYLNAEVDHNKSIKIIRIKDTYKNGCTSPVMYLEALNIYNAQPNLLRVLNRFEIQVIKFGCRYKMINEKFAMQIGEVISNDKLISYEYIDILQKLYNQFEKDEILGVCISNMIKAGVTDKEAAPIYEKGILRGLRITKLYEFYIASIQKDVTILLPKMVLMYFAYDNQLDYAYKAFLYANILHNKKEYREVYNSYEKNIEMYVYEQLREGNVDDNLAMLYREFLKPELLRDETAEFMSKLRFMYRVTCFDDVVDKILVKYGEKEKPEIYDVEGKVTYIPMYTSDCALTFICKDGVVRKSSINYEIEKAFGEPEGLKEFAGYNINNDFMLIYRANYLRTAKVFDSNTLNVYKRAARTEGITKQYRDTLNSWMIDYYSEYYPGDNFKHEYTWILRDNLDISTSSKLIELLIDYGMYMESYELMEKYGFAYIAPSNVFKLLVHQLEYSDDYSEEKNQLARCAFTNHLYNENVLSYMIKYFNGTNDEMYDVWKASINFGMDVEPLSERVIAQMIFTGKHTGRLTEVFTDYYRKGARNVIVKAYAAYNAFLYLVKQKKANDIVFSVIEEAFEQDLGLPQICFVAWLKELSKKAGELKKSDKLPVVQKLFTSLCKQDIIYEFYKEFKGVLVIPYNVLGVTVIQYFADPDSKVTIHYTYDTESQEYNEKVMKCDQCGIFTFRVNLFYNDRIKYYFTENDNDHVTESEVYNLVCDDFNSECTEGRYDAINDCLACVELHDMVTLKKIMHGYVVEDYVTKQLFKPMKG